MANAWNYTCPSCKSPKAYHGFNSYECPNENCVHFTKKQKLAVELEHATEDAIQESLELDITTHEQDKTKTPIKALDPADIIKAWYGVTPVPPSPSTTKPGQVASASPTDNDEQPDDEYDLFDTIYDPPDPLSFTD